MKNIFQDIYESSTEEIFEIILGSENMRLERIISNGHATPPGEWYDQDNDEWVLLVKGSAGLLFEGDVEIVALKPGDYIHIPAHRKHRVEWTDCTEKTIWLALHYNPRIKL